MLSSLDAVVVDSVIKDIEHLQCDPKLLSEFPWSVIFKPERIK